MTLTLIQELMREDIVLDATLGGTIHSNIPANIAAKYHAQVNCSPAYRQWVREAINRLIAKKHGVLCHVYRGWFRYTVFVPTTGEKVEYVAYCLEALLARGINTTIAYEGATQ